MHKEILSWSQVAKLFMAGFCALFLGTTVRYYTVQAFESEDGAPKQTASLVRLEDGVAENSSAQESAVETAQVPMVSVAGETGESDAADINTSDVQNNNEVAVTTLQTENNATENPTPAPQVAGSPNLTVIGLVVNPLPMDKDRLVRITATVRNTGTGQAVNVSGALSNTTNGYALGVHTGYTFAPGQQYDFWEEDAYPYFATCEGGGANVLRFTVDPGNIIQESNENDNTFEIAAALVGC